MIRQWVLPALTFSAHGRPSAVEPVELVEVMRYRLKSGCQWCLLPVKPFFTGASLTWHWLAFSAIFLRKINQKPTF